MTTQAHHHRGQHAAAAIAFLFALGFLGAAPAYAGEELPPAEFVLKVDPPTGSNIRHVVSRIENVPMNRRYDQLTAEQKAYVASWYGKLEAGTEPPFPQDGLKPIYEAAYLGQQKYRVKGELLIFASVDVSGQVDAVQVHRSPDPRMTDFMARILMLTKFKPAVCGGKPCRMDHPFLLDFRLE